MAIARDVIKYFNWHPFLILNPIVGELVEKSDELLNFFLSEENNIVFRPAFIYQDNSEDLLSLIVTNNLEDVMIICLEEFTHDGELMKLIEHEKVNSIVLLEPNRHRRLDKKIRELKKILCQA